MFGVGLGTIAIVLAALVRLLLKKSPTALVARTLPPPSNDPAPHADSDLAALAEGLPDLKARALAAREGMVSVARHGPFVFGAAIVREESRWTYHFDAMSTRQPDRAALLYLIGFLAGNLRIPLDGAELTLDTRTATLAVPVSEPAHTRWAAEPVNITDLRTQRAIARSYVARLERIGRSPRALPLRA